MDALAILPTPFRMNVAGTILKLTYTQKWPPWFFLPLAGWL
jgi:hypothetical protein